MRIEHQDMKINGLMKQLDKLEKEISQKYAGLEARVLDTLAEEVEPLIEKVTNLEVAIELKEERVV